MTHFTPPDGTRVHAVLTGPIRRDITLADGTVVDARPEVAFVETPEQQAELAHLIGEHYAERGHPDHDDDDVPFEHDVETSRANLEAHPMNRQEG